MKAVKKLQAIDNSFFQLLGINRGKHSAFRQIKTWKLKWCQSINFITKWSAMKIVELGNQIERGLDWGKQLFESDCLVFTLQMFYTYVPASAIQI